MEKDQEEEVNNFVEGNTDAALGDVRKMVRPDWLNQDNKLFINKLNFIC